MVGVLHSIYYVGILVSQVPCAYVLNKFQLPSHRSVCLSKHRHRMSFGLRHRLLNLIMTSSNRWTELKQSSEGAQNKIRRVNTWELKLERDCDLNVVRDLSVIATNTIVRSSIESTCWHQSTSLIAGIFWSVSNFLHPCIKSINSYAAFISNLKLISILS